MVDGVRTLRTLWTGPLGSPRTRDVTMLNAQGVSASQDTVAQQFLWKCQKRQKRPKPAFHAAFPTDTCTDTSDTCGPSLGLRGGSKVAGRCDARVSAAAVRFLKKGRASGTVWCPQPQSDARSFQGISGYRAAVPTNARTNEGPPGAPLFNPPQRRCRLSTVLGRRNKGGKTMSAKSDNYDPTKHPRQPDHSAFIARVTAAVSPKVADEPTQHPPHSMGNRRPDKGRAHHAGEANPSGRGPHN